MGRSSIQIFGRPTEEMTDDDVVGEIMAFIDEAVAESRARAVPVAEDRPPPITRSIHAAGEGCCTRTSTADVSDSE